jgi:hypothetical membrane protein
VKPNARLVCAPLSAILFLIGTLGVAHFLPGYSHVRQAVSEIGALGAPTRIPFAVLACLVGLCVFIFGTALGSIAKRYAVSVIPAYLTAFVALTEIGIGIFAMPHPLHGPIGLSALLGFQAPGVLALSWRRNVKLRPLIAPSWGFLSVSGARRV